MGGTTATQPPARRWQDLQKRFLSALALGPAVLVCIWVGGLPWSVLVALASAILAWEWVRLCGLRNRALPGIIVPVSVLASVALAILGRPDLSLGALALGTLAAVLAGLRGASGAPVSRIFAFGVAYVGLSTLALAELRAGGEAGRANVLFLFMTVWACDIGAYLAGRAIGGPKLWPAVSPNKTWSGAGGGLVGAVLVGLGTAQALAPGGIGRAMVFALLLGAASQAGDLLESAIKRHFNVKDTSGLIPGHGGLLDRLDGVMAAAPVAVLIALAVGQAHPLWR